MLSINDTQLVILDFQGKLSQIVYQSETVLSKASALIKGIRHLEIPITWVEQTPEKLGQTTPENVLFQPMPLKKLRKKSKVTSASKSY